MELTACSRELREGISKAAEVNCFQPIVVSLSNMFNCLGIPVDRIHLPINKIFGFRHPRYASVSLRWVRGKGPNVHYIYHEELIDRPFSVRLKDSPYQEILDGEKTFHSFDLRQSKLNYPLLEELREEGYVEYCCLVLQLPCNGQQILSLATRSLEGFGENFQSEIARIGEILSLALYSIYQQSASVSIASTYLGARTGSRVLQGEISRGERTELEAGILFCDVRGFTSLSEKLGAQEMVMVMNRVFEVLGEAVVRHDAEILKFIGDAMLILFNREQFPCDGSMGKAMYELSKDSIRALQELAKELNLPISVGFGGHIGEVVYGNIGTKDRLDFTIMGPAVNLASRLESLCKELDSQVNLTQRAATGYLDELKDLGLQRLKGVQEPVRVYGIPSA